MATKRGLTNRFIMLWLCGVLIISTFGSAGIGATSVQAASSKIVQVAAGTVSAYALMSDGTVFEWGETGKKTVNSATGELRHAPRKVEGLTGVKMVSAGMFVAAVKNDGTVWAWDVFANGSKWIKPTKIEGLSGITKVEVGDGFLAALKSDGTVWMWGENLGRNRMGVKNAPKLVYKPIKVEGMKNIVDIEVGGNNTYALSKDGVAWAWGSDSNKGVYLFGEETPQPIIDYDKPLKGSDAEYKAAAKAKPLTGIREIVASSSFGYAVMKDGSVRRWGMSDRSAFGQAFGDARFARTVPQLRGAKEIQVSAMDTVVRMADGRLYGMGENWSNILGAKGNQAGPNPVPIEGLDGIERFALSKSMTYGLALKKNGDLIGWGNNIRGQSDPRAVINRALPGRVKIDEVVDFAFVKDGVVAVRKDGSIWRWGGEGVSSRESDLFVPTRIGGIEQEIRSLQSYADEVYAIASNGEVWEWRNLNAAPEKVSGWSQVREIVFGGKDGPYALTEDGQVLRRKPVPSPVPELEGTKKINCYESRCLAVSSNGGLSYWDGEKLQSVTGLSGVDSATVISDTLYAVLTDGSVWSADTPRTGQSIRFQKASVSKDPVKEIAGDSNGPFLVFGKDGKLTISQYYIQKNLDGEKQYGMSAYAPKQSMNIPNVVAVSVGLRQSILLLHGNGTVSGMFKNDEGQLGDGTRISKDKPVPVKGLSDIVKVETSGTYSIALKKDGTLWAWGEATRGFLGDGSGYNRVLEPALIRF